MFLTHRDFGRQAYSMNAVSHHLHPRNGIAAPISSGRLDRPNSLDRTGFLHGRGLGTRAWEPLSDLVLGRRQPEPRRRASPFSRQLRRRDSHAGHRHAGLVTVVAKPEICAGDSRTRSLPGSPAGDMTKNHFVISDLIHLGASPSLCREQLAQFVKETGRNDRLAGRKLSRFNVAG